MKTITKIKESSKAVAGTALLVGATLAGGAAFATAQDSGSSGDATLGDYPSPFIDDDGNIASTIVMGQDAKATDVVAATEIAGQLGNDAFSSETVSAGGASFGWSADGGVTLDTRNDDLYFGQSIDEVRQTLTDEQLDVLETTEGLSGDEEQEVEQYLYLGNQEIGFGTPGDTDNEEDPFLYVNNPSDVKVGEDGDAADDAGRLYKLQANFEDGVEFQDTSEGDNKNEDVYGEEFEMFGKTMTVGADSFTDGNEGQLILYGSQEEIDVASGESETITVAGEEVSIEVVGVTSSNTAAVRIDGSLEQYEEDDEETINGEDLRIDDIIQTNADNSQGVVQFAIGSEQYTLEDGSAVMEGSDEDDIDGTQVALSGSNIGSNVEDDPVELSSIEVATGASDSDENYVRADEPMEDPVFDDVEFHFGGLNPDAEEGGDNVAEIEFGTDGDDTATVSFSEGEDSLTQGFVYDSDLDDNADGSEALAADEGDDIHVVEGESVEADEYFVSDAGDFSHMWEVTDIDPDEAEDGNIEADDEATIDLTDAVTGNTVEVDIDAANIVGGAYYEGEEVIDGQTYHFRTEASDNINSFTATWGSSSNFDNAGDETSVFTAVDTDSDAAVAFADTAVLDEDIEGEDPGITLELPSTESTDAKTVEISHTQDGAGGPTPDEVTVTTSEGASGTYTGTGDDQTVNLAVTVGQTDYEIQVSGVDDEDEGNTVTVDNVALRANQGADADTATTTGGDAAAPSALVLQPEDDNDNEDSYVVTPGNDADDEEVDVGGSSGSISYSGGYAGTTQTLESDDDIEVGYNMFGTYTEQDTDEQGSFALHVPNGQATAGAAVTGAEGDLSADAGSSSGSVDTMTPTGWPAQSVALDNDDFVPNARTSSNLILVGGPAANSLVGELADENQTWSTSDYTEGEGLLQLVPEAFNEDYHALVVAGFTGEDTRQAGEFLSNYEQNSEALAGQTQVSISTAEGSVVQ